MKALLDIMNIRDLSGFSRLWRVNCFFRGLSQEYLQMINVIIVVSNVAGNLVDDTFEFFKLFGTLFHRPLPVQVDNSAFQVPGECRN